MSLLGRKVPSSLARSAPVWSPSPGRGRAVASPAPDINAAYGSPQDMTWCMGTVDRMVSPLRRAALSAMHICMEWSQMDRCV